MVTRVARIAAINFAVLFCGLLIAELIFGNWIFGPDYREMNIPRNTVRKLNAGEIYPGGGITTYSRDEHGLRGPYDDVSKIDILTLGGSTTNQLFIDDDETWQAHLRRLAAADGMPVTVVNAAVDGQSSRGHIVVFDRWFPLIDGLRARYVLAYVGINDVTIGGQQKYDDMRSPDESRRLLQWVKNKSAVYEMFKVVQGMYRASRADLTHGGRPPTPADAEWTRWRRRDAPSATPDIEGIAERLDAYAARLRTLAGKIRDFGAEPIFVTQPSANYRLSEEWILMPIDGRAAAIRYYSTLDAFNRVTMSVCADVGAICLDLARELSFSDGDFYDHIHNTDRGTAKVGAYLFEKLKPILKR